MTFTLRLEQADGTPADPPTMESTVTNWRTGDTIPIGREHKPDARPDALVVALDDAC